MGNPTLRVLDIDASLDGIISYSTDAVPLWTKHADWVAGFHRHKKRFADQLCRAGEELMTAAASWSGEQAEAVAATATQNEAVTRAKELCRDVRTKGQYIAGELNLEPDSATLARDVLVATGVGLRVNLDRQSGIRRLLRAQARGVTGLGVEMLAEWNLDPNLARTLTRAEESLSQSITDQSKEVREAVRAKADLDDQLQQTVTLLNRAIRLVNAFAGQCPKELHLGLLRLQGDHPGVYHASRKKKAKEGNTPA